MNSEINIVYDITILGESSVSLASRTGVFRVVENILTILAKSGRFNILLYPGKMNYWECLEYLKNNKNINRCERYVPKCLFIHLIFGRSINFLFSRINKSTVKAFEKVSLKILCKFLRLLHHLFLKISVAWEHGRKKKIFSKFDIYHTSLYPVPHLIKKMQTIKRFITVFDIIPILHPEFFTDGINHPLRKMITELNANDFILSISKATKTDLCEYNKEIDPDHVHVTYLAASEEFKPCKSADIIREIKNKYNIPHDARYVLSVATLEPRKNLSALIKSFRELLFSEKMSDLYLVLTGAIGWKCEHLFEEIDNSKEVSEKIILTGYVADDDLSPLYSGAMVFVYPSMYEGFGLPPLEAMQCGTPVITSDTSSLPEVVGDAGIMFDQYDIKSISNSILTIYNNDELREKLSKKSLERASIFSWDKTAEQTVQAYKKAISMNR